MRKQLCLWLMGGAAVFLPAVAQAEDEPKPYPECIKTPTDAEIAAAKGAYQAGNASFDEADYPRAITYWEDAYRRDCTANLLLKNLARAYELYGEKRQAVVALETYLIREPSSGDKDQIQRRIEVLKKQIAAEKATPVAAGTPPPPVAPPVRTATVASEPQAEPAPQSGKRPIAPLIVAGGGAVVAIVGLAVYAGAAKDYKSYKAQCPFDSTTGKYNCTTNGVPDDSLRDKANSADKKRYVGGVVAGIGAAGLAGGLIWYFAQPRSATTTGSLLRPNVNPSLTPGFAGLSLSGAF